ncbi:MAG: hypothetical protein IKF78_16335 [Atopobiaceae bacterium]|nr:hypothetical protein [Atopobiaceae bacterium]
MGRSKKPKQACNRADEVYWGSLSYNGQLLSVYKNIFYMLAMTRFEWIGLPKTVDPLFLERQLLLGGHATIAQPKKGKQRGFWYSAKCVQTGPLGVYDYPKSWQAYNRDQLRFNATGKNGVWIYDNVMRFPLCAALDIFARELVDVQKTEQVNRFWQKLPFILVAPDDMELSANNLLSQVMGGEPAIAANRYVKDMEPYRLGFDVPFLGRELNAAEQNVLNKVYTILGIANLTFKSERMIEDEVHDMGEPSTLMALAALTERRRAADYLNTRFGMNVSVVWRTDYQSENFNLLESIEKSAKILTGNTKGLAEVMQSE